MVNAATEETALAAVKMDGKWGFVDKNGQLVIKVQFDDVNSFSEGLAPAKINNKWGVVNRTGEFILQPQFDYIGSFRAGVAVIIDNKRWSYIDKTGQSVSCLFVLFGTMKNGEGA